MSDSSEMVLPVPEGISKTQWPPASRVPGALRVSGYSVHFSGRREGRERVEAENGCGIRLRSHM